MNTQYCPECNQAIKHDIKFCTHCGARIEELDTKKEETSDRSLSKNGENKSSSKILYIFLALLVFAFAAKTYLTDIDVSNNSLQKSNTLEQIVGEWQEPTGTLLKDKKAIIRFRKKGDIVVGEDADKRLYIQLIPTSNRNLSGLVVLDGIDGDFLVDYYKDENKLVFFSTLTKTSWYLNKI